MDRSIIKKGVTDFIAKYKYAVLILAVGVLLMILPETDKKQTEETLPEQVAAQEQSLEEKLSQVLSMVKGAGRVEVVLTYASGQQTVYQTDTDRTEGDNSQSLRTDTVTVTDSERNQTGLVQRVDPPVCLGAVVVCQGADDPGVKLAVMEAVSTATGLRTDKISILKMK